MSNAGADPKSSCHPSCLETFGMLLRGLVPNVTCVQQWLRTLWVKNPTRAHQEAVIRGSWHNVIPAGFKIHMPSDLSKGSPTSDAAPTQCLLLLKPPQSPRQGLDAGNITHTAESALGRGNSLQLPALADKTVSFHLLLPFTPPLHSLFSFWLHPRARAALCPASL